MMATPPPVVRFVDVAVNLTDPCFRGIDRERQGVRLRPDDFDDMMRRAADRQIEAIIITGTSIAQSREAVQLCRQWNHRCREADLAGATRVPRLPRLYCTVGVHPAHVDELFEDHTASDVGSDINATSAQGTAAICDRISSTTLGALRSLVTMNRDVVVALGEIGTDGAELRPPGVTLSRQRLGFHAQLDLLSDINHQLSGGSEGNEIHGGCARGEYLSLPVLLHSREASEDFLAVLEAFHTTDRCGGHHGVLHCFGGSRDELNRVLALGYSVSVCMSAFRTEETAKLVATSLPLDRLMLETDAPWCDLRPQHWAFTHVTTHFPTRKLDKWVPGVIVARQTEPCHIVQVMEALVHARHCFGVTDKAACDMATDMASVAHAAFSNACRIFRLPYTRL